MTIVEATRSITGGGDTHLDVHVAAALDPVGGLLGVESFGVGPDGYAALLAWLEGFGEVGKVGVEGTGSYGAGLARFLRERGVVVIEVDRPNRAERRRSGKSDPLDATEAAWAALSGRAKSLPKARDGGVEAIRMLLVAKRSARQARVKALTQMRHLVITGPEELQGRLKGLTPIAWSWPVPACGPIARATPCWRRRRWRSLPSPIASRPWSVSFEISRSASWCSSSAPLPSSSSVLASGPTPPPLVVTAGDNPERLHSEAAFAHLCGVSPIPASSGKTSGHVRLDSGGDRQANSALWRIVMVRIAHDPRTIAYFERKVKEGCSKRDVIRILKRYVARELYRYLPRG
jgi:transposase